MYLIFIQILSIIFMNSLIVISSSEYCESLNSDIHIVKDEHKDTGDLLRTCSGEISVSKCEGYCNSQVQPSIVTSTGFLKECFCCREEYMKERTILLSHCYDSNGIRLYGEENATMAIKIREPADCKCIKCGL